MKQIQQSFTLDIPYSFSYPKEQILFFDIETTGLSADVSSLYLIGCLFYKDNSFTMIQWFANDYQSECCMLTAFFNFLKNYKLLIHYNGTSFDIPYLLKKCEQYHLPYNFSQIKNIDLYKIIYPYKKRLSLPNLKQKTIEQWLGFIRTDSYNGKELIFVYSEFIKGTYLKQSNLESLSHILLLHNQEDIIGLTYITFLLHYIDLFETPPNKLSILVENQNVTIRIPLFFSSILELKWSTTICDINLKKQQLELSIPFYQGELKYFYKNYKDYFYLPQEDTAIHKSVAQFVEKEYREKAKASTCYTKKMGLFLPFPNKTSSYPIFVSSYKDSLYYIEFTNILQNDIDFFKTYAILLLSQTK